MPVQGEFFQNPGSAGGFYDYQIEQSLRFDRSDNSGLQWGGAGSYTLGSPTNSYKYTWSAWLKRGLVGNYSMNVIHAHTGSGGINSAFDEIGAKEGDFYPVNIRDKIDSLNDRIYKSLNNGVYQCGFATSANTAKNNNLIFWKGDIYIFEII